LSDGQVPADLGPTDTRQAVKPDAAPNVGGTYPFSRDPAGITCAASLRAAIGTAIEEQWRRNEEQFEALLEGSSFCKPANAAAAAAQERTGRGAWR
jgi:hypothetical protein